MNNALLIVSCLALIGLAAQVKAVSNTDYLQVYGVAPGDDSQVKVDGVLDENVWGDSAGLGEFHISNTARSNPEKRPTLARAFYTKDALYLAIECFENEMPAQDEVCKLVGCVEVFLEAGRTQGRFYKYVADAGYYSASFGPGNLAMSVVGGRYDNFWGVGSGYQGAVKGTTDRWTVEMKMPFKAMSSRPAAGDLWLFNVRRFTFMKGFEDISWAPGAKYDTPYKFGYLYFQEKPGQFDLNSLVALSAERGGLPVEVMSSTGRLLARSNAELLDEELNSADDSLALSRELLDRASLPEKTKADLEKRLKELAVSVDDFTRLRGKGEVSALLMSGLYMQAQNAARTSRQLCRELQGQIQLESFGPNAQR